MLPVVPYISGTISAAVMVGEISAMFCASSSLKFKQFARSLFITFPWLTFVFFEGGRRFFLARRQQNSLLRQRQQSNRRNCAMLVEKIPIYRRTGNRRSHN